MIRRKKAFILIDLTVSIICIMILILPVLRCAKVISKNINYSLDIDEISYIIDCETQRIEECNGAVQKDTEIDGYLVKTSIKENINSNIILLEVEILKDDKKVSGFNYYKYIN